MAIKNANRKASRKRDERKNETREKEETPSAPIKIPPPLQHAALLTLLVRSQVAPALVVSLTTFFKSALRLFVALTPALELRSFVYFECFYMHLKWIRAIIVRLTECSSICVCVCVGKITFIRLCIWLLFLPVFLFALFADAKILIWILHVLKTHYCCAYNSILKVGQWANVRPTPMSAVFDASFLYFSIRPRSCLLKTSPEIVVALKSGRLCGNLLSCFFSKFY